MIPLTRYRLMFTAQSPLPVHLGKETVFGLGGYTLELHP